MIGSRWLLAAACAAAFLGTAAAAFQDEKKKDADLPAEIAKLPFEIKDGYRRFVRRCTGCHDDRRVQDAKAKNSLFDWQGVIAKMADKKDADIPQEDRQAIFLYLAYLHGTSGTEEQKEQYLAFLTKCEDCHGIGLVYKDKKPMKEWPGLIHRMAVKDRAQIAPDDEPRIMGYISRMYPDLFGVE